MKEMKVWYIVKFGAIVCEETFDTMEDAEKKAHMLTCLSGHKWRAERVCGWD